MEPHALVEIFFGSWLTTLLAGIGLCFRTFVEADIASWGSKNSVVPHALTETFLAFKFFTLFASEIVWFRTFADADIARWGL